MAEMPDAFDAAAVEAYLNDRVSAANVRSSMRVILRLITGMGVTHKLGSWDFSPPWNGVLHSIQWSKVASSNVSARFVGVWTDKGDRGMPGRVEGFGYHDAQGWGRLVQKFIARIRYPQSRSSGLYISRGVCSRRSCHSACRHRFAAERVHSVWRGCCLCVSQG